MHLLVERSWDENRYAHLKEYHGNHKTFKSLYDSRGRCLKIRDVCMDFEPYFKVHNLVSIHPKIIILGQMTNLNIIYRFVKIWTRPSFLLNFGTADSISSPQAIILDFFFFFLPKRCSELCSLKWNNTGDKYGIRAEHIGLAVLPLRRLERVFSCTRASNLHTP